MKLFYYAKKALKKCIILSWKTLRVLHIIPEYTYRGLMFHFTDEHKFISINKYFDRKWYIKHYKDVNCEPVLHYARIGFREGKSPGPNFDGMAYLKLVRKIRPLTMSALLDIHIKGLAEHKPCPCVTNYWGCFEHEGRKYLVLSSILKALHVFHNEVELEEAFVETSAVEFFRIYIKKEFHEYAYMYDITDLEIKDGTEFRAAGDYKLPMYILTLFAWSGFSNDLFLGKGLYLANREDKLVVTSRENFINIYNETLLPHQKDYFNQFAAIKKEEKIYTLFAEFRNITNDNTWQVFNEAVKHDDNCIFITARATYDEMEDEFLKSHMVVYNSEEHIQAFMRAKKIFCSWTLSDIVPTVFKHEFFGTPFMTKNWYYCPHGISYDKNSYFLTPIFLSQPKKVYCCSLNEKDYFENKCGLKNVTVLGYPRMDKWAEPEGEDILFNFTYRKKYNQAYFDIIKNAVDAVREKYGDRKIYYLFHPAIGQGKQDYIKELLGEENIEYAHASDQASFNSWFNKCKYLVTDYSSVAYDFAYKKNGISIYYMEEGFTENHYELYDCFYDKHCGVIVKNTEELLEVLDKDVDLSDVNRRKNDFFKYIDKNNTKRVYEDAFVEKKK